MTIEKRLENMERELGRVKRRNRWLLGVIVLVAGGLIVPAVFETTAFRARAQGAGTAKEVRAKSFVLEDERGEARGFLGVTKDGPGLALADEKGNSRVLLGVTKDGPRLKLLDENGKVRATLIVVKEGPVLLLVDEKGKTRFIAGRARVVMSGGKTIEYPESSLVLIGPDGKVIWSAIQRRTS